MQLLLLLISKFQFCKYHSTSHTIMWPYAYSKLFSFKFMFFIIKCSKTVWSQHFLSIRDIARHRGHGKMPTPPRASLPRLSSVHLLPNSLSNKVIESVTPLTSTPQDSNQRFPVGQTTFLLITKTVNYKTSNENWRCLTIDNIGENIPYSEQEAKGKGARRGHDASLPHQRPVSAEGRLLP